MALNLVQHRGEPSIWDERATGWSELDIERWLAAVAAGALFITGVRRRSVGGFMLAVGSTTLAWWAAGCSDERRIRRAYMRATMPSRAASEDIVHEAAEESFPASDPPSWTPTTGNTGPRENRIGR